MYLYNYIYIIVIYILYGSNIKMKKYIFPMTFVHLLIIYGGCPIILARLDIITFMNRLDWQELWEKTP